MAIPTSRTKEKAEIFINEEKCIGCGLCVSVCNDFSIIIENKKAKISNDTSIFGCIGCGHCIAICPTGAISIKGRELSEDDLFELPSKEESATFEKLLALLKQRRSIREFIDKDVPKEIIDKILEAAQTAPMGLPPSDVNVLVFDSREKVNKLSKDFCEYLEGIKWLVSNWFLAIMRPFWGQATDELFKGFVKPLFKAYTEFNKKGEDIVTYNAPLAMYFYGSEYSDPADPIIAATYSMLAGETLGLGTCMLGGVHPFIQSGKKAKLFREKYGIKSKSREGLIVIFGYPKVKYQKGIKRTFASIDFK